ncbi:MAG TPA: LUD domain-containing protein [Rhizomicrobium sp.]|jgi:L-lactate dehydrogenase complex protein LldG|nr:LUD domain-containing protein [Rhizomicrobium sp.]
MNAREEILSAIRARRASPGTAGLPAKDGWDARGPKTNDDNLAHFTRRAKAAAAQVNVLGSTEEIPATVADALRSRNLPAIVHLPPDSLLEEISWSSAPGLSVVRNIPSGDDVAVAIACYAIAETGTLVYPASPVRPPSWHFRPGVEVALLAADNIYTCLEDVLEQITRRGALPSTINLVTGPSRTGDIEQTLELGAHGPKELIILIVPSLGGQHA